MVSAQFTNVFILLFSLLLTCSFSAPTTAQRSGHIVKRRAHSMGPVSAELLELYRSPKSPINVSLLSQSSRQKIKMCAHFICIKSTKSMKRNSSSNRLCNVAAFPGTALRGHVSPASSPNASSPRTRHQTSSNATQLPQIFPPHAQLSRIESSSSATLFFGPPTPPAQKLAPTTQSHTNTNLSAATPAPVLCRQNTQPEGNQSTS